MTDFTAEHFDELCRAGPVRSRMDSLEATRKQALKQFWKRLGLTILAAVVLGAGIATTLHDVTGLVIGWLLFIAGAVWSWQPIHRAQQGLKLPVLEALAEKAGMHYLQEGFDPPVFAEAQPAIFGKWISSATFTDLFHGQDSEGSNFAFYEACLTRRVGKNTAQIFSGQVYAFQRRPGRQGWTVILPDKGIFNFFKPGPGMERVNFEGDEAFERKFEVYSTQPLEAKMLLASPAVRDQLREARGEGWAKRLLVYLGPTDAFIAIQGGNRFEPGSMFRSRSSEERVRIMFDEVCGSLTLLKRLKDAFG
jgi:hypothetical protein